MHKIFYINFCVAYVFLLPGYLLARTFFKDNGGFILGATLAVVLLPVLAFGVAMLLHTVISDVLLFILATAISIGLSLVSYLHNQQDRIMRRS